MITTYIVIGICVILVIFLCFALAVASFSFDNYAENLKKTNDMKNSYGISTLDYVSQVNKKYFASKLQIMQCPEYQDHYSAGVVALSEKTMYSNSLASLAIVSHELGHARQDASGNKLRKHWSLRRTGRICGYFFLPLILIGVVLSLLQVFGVLEGLYFLIVGLSCLVIAFVIFVFALVLKYKEIQVEKEASIFALEFLQEILTEPEISICRDFLNSARLTYWAGLFRTMLGWTMLTKKDSMFR